jgi:hypothetical protein
MLLANAGDVDGARAAYQIVIDSGDREQGAEAAAALGPLLAEGGDLTGAREALQRAADSAHPERGPRSRTAWVHCCSRTETGEVPVPPTGGWSSPAMPRWRRGPHSRWDRC